MASLAGIQALFYPLLVLFQEVTQPLMLVYLECYCYLLGQHSQFSILHFAQIFCHHNTFAWHYKSADHSFFQPSTFKFLLVFVHFFLSWSDCKNSFLQWHQNSLTMCWTCLHLLWLYKSGLEKSPGDGKIIFDFMVKMFDGDRDKLLVRSLVLSVVKVGNSRFLLCH